MIFVTGATGFLGAHLLYRLVMLGRPVRALVRDRSKIDAVRRIWDTYPDKGSDRFNRISWVTGDIRDYPLLAEQIGEAAQVYHLAGWVGFDKADRKPMTEVNVTGTAHVVNACLQSGKAKLCHVSSIAALGEADDGSPADETRLWVEGSSSSVYAQTKFHGEMEVWRGIYEGLPAVIVNPSVITGPGMWEGPAGNLLRQLKKGLPFYPPGTSGYVDVRDVVDIMVSLMDSELAGERYIVSAENLAHRDVIGYMAEVIGATVPARELKPLMIRLGSTAEWIRSILTGTRPRFSRESLSVSLSHSAYSNRKITSALSCTFTPVRESVQSALRQYLSL